MKIVFFFAVSLACLSCNGGKKSKDRLIGIVPDVTEKRTFGLDYVINMLYRKPPNDEDLFGKVIIELEEKGHTRGGRETDNFSGLPFLLRESKEIANKEIIRKKTYVFNDSETALLVYDLNGWVLVEINKW
jgi:hypothetical protein